MKEKLILITGGSGYIGSHIARQYNNCIIFDKKEPNFECNYISGDFTNKKEINDVFKNNKIDIVIHCGALKDVAESVDKPLLYYNNNVIGTYNLLESMKENNINNIIFLSTSAVYKEGIVNENSIIEPITPYGTTKLNCEDMIRYSGINYVIFRLFNVYGYLGNKLIKNIMDKKEIKIFGCDYGTIDGTPIRDFIHINDIINAIDKSLLLLECKQNGLFNLGSGKGITIKQLCDKYNCPYEIVERRTGDIAISTANIDKIERVLNWKPNKFL